MHTTACATTQLLASADVAREAIQRGDNLTPARVRLAAVTGRLKVAATTPSGQRLFDPVDVAEFLHARAQRRAESA